MTEDDKYIPARAVWERYGVTDMTLHRWIRDVEMGFPAPHYFGRFRYWRLADLLDWEAKSPRGRTRAAAMEAAWTPRRTGCRDAEATLGRSTPVFWAGDRSNGGRFCTSWAVWSSRWGRDHRVQAACRVSSQRKRVKL